MDAQRLYELKGATEPLNRLRGTEPAVEQIVASAGDLALARLDERGNTETRTPLARNSAVRRAERLVACFNARDFDGARLLIGSDFARFDRRHGVSAPTADGADAYMDAARAWYDVGFDELILEPLAVRGESLMLSRGGYRATDGREVMFLVVYELDADGLIARGTHFDEDELDAALAELDERYLAGEGAVHLDLLAAGAAFMDATRRDDFGAMRELMSPGFVWVDHGLLGMGAGDCEEFIAASRTLREVSADGIRIMRSVEVERNAVLALVESTQITEQGNEYGRVLCILLAVDAANRPYRTEYFDEDQYPQAHARLHELGAQTVPEVENVASRSARDAYADARTRLHELATTPPAAMPTLDNAVTAALRHVVALAERNDFDEIEALCEELCAEDIERLDHRGGVAGMPLRGRAEIVRLFHETFAVFPVFTAQPIAVRGERLALTRVQMASPEGFEIRLVGLYDHDSDGRLTFFAHYDESDLPAALDELDARYIAAEGAEYAYIIGRIRDHGRAGTDADALRALYAPNAVIHNNRQFAWPMTTVEDMIERLGSDTGVADSIYLSSWVEYRSDTAISLVEQRLTTLEGNQYTNSFWRVQHWTAGLIDHVEFFGLEDFGTARSCFEDLAREPRTPYVDNALIRTFVRGDWLIRYARAEERIELLAPEVVEVDHRRGVSAPDVAGIDAYLENQRAVRAVMGSGRVEYLAVRGDRLLLARVSYTSPEHFTAAHLALFEADDAGRLCHNDIWDEVDLLVAIDAMESRHRELAGESLSAFERAGFVNEQMRMLTEVAPDAVFMRTKSYSSGSVGLFCSRISGSTIESDAYERAPVHVVRLGDDGRAVRHVAYPEDRWTEALALFDEWVGSTA